MGTPGQAHHVTRPVTERPLGLDELQAVRALQSALKAKDTARLQLAHSRTPVESDKAYRSMDEAEARIWRARRELDEVLVGAEV